jgi:large subunit ribosomal protein L6
MSRVGNSPILIPEGVNVQINPLDVIISGKLGSLTQTYDTILVEKKENQLLVSREKNNNEHKSKHGLYRSLFANMITGVSEGYTIDLELVGVGYRASNSGQNLQIALGFSHNIVIKLADEVKVQTISEKGANPIIKLTSHDKQLVGMVAAKIRSFRKPEPYKGKGVRYVGEQIRRKAGKSA